MILLYLPFLFSEWVQGFIDYRYGAEKSSSTHITIIWLLGVFLAAQFGHGFQI